MKQKITAIARFKVTGEKGHAVSPAEIHPIANCVRKSVTVTAYTDEDSTTPDFSLEFTPAEAVAFIARMNEALIQVLTHSEEK